MEINKYKLEEKRILSEIIDSFDDAVRRFQKEEVASCCQIVFYGVLKTKADILVELQEFDLAIKAYKKLKDECQRQ